MPQLLLAEEDADARAYLAENLTADGYTVRLAANRQAAARTLVERAVDVIVVDVNGQTLALLDWLRGDAPDVACSADVPVIALMSRTDVVHRVRLLERGADDVIEKPYAYLELRARLSGVLRRTQPRQPALVTVAGPVRIDRRTRAVSVHGRPIGLCPKEYSLLLRLASDPARVFTRAELLSEVWGHGGYARTRTLDTHAHRLRAKLRDAAPNEPLLSSVWGVGYRLIDGELHEMQ